ncbi:hypothetical protein UFOVP49_7 [uncultured Caudovirales phage]|uniref:Uncharacterized protein n=1 Tax=uncultured Caudovirales phage TaxID=2100421 RepID=A0A6J5KV73_9CAUD|nr:hypothetical protein UFOVP49_7 [uncultured Caudovirales phage]
MYAKVKEHKTLVRDMQTSAILNIDESALRKHDTIMHQKQKEKTTQEQINSLKGDISEIKEMLKSLKDRGI